MTGVITWLAPADCDPPHGLDFTTAHDAHKVRDLAVAFADRGFDKRRPALVGYVKDGRVQLLSGTHRHAAAQLVGIRLPVSLWLGSTIDTSWGTLEEWQRIMQDLPVCELERWTRADVERARGARR